MAESQNIIVQSENLETPNVGCGEDMVDNLEILSKKWYERPIIELTCLSRIICCRCGVPTLSPKELFWVSRAPLLVILAFLGISGFGAYIFLHVVAIEGDHDKSDYRAPLSACGLLIMGMFCRLYFGTRAELIQLQKKFNKLIELSKQRIEQCCREVKFANKKVNAAKKSLKLATDKLQKERRDLEDHEAKLGTEIDSILNQHGVLQSHILSQRKTLTNMRETAKEHNINLKNIDREEVKKMRADLIKHRSQIRHANERLKEQRILQIWAFFRMSEADAGYWNIRDFKLGLEYVNKHLADGTRTCAPFVKFCNRWKDADAVFQKLSDGGDVVLARRLRKAIQEELSESETQKHEKWMKKVTNMFVKDKKI